MAELVLKVGPGGGYEDGDVLCSFNDKAIQLANAQMLCNPWINGVNEFGTRIIDSIAEDYFKRTSLYKFERISKTEINKINLQTLESEILGPSQINIELWLKRRMAERAPDGGPQLAIFGDPEALVWYEETYDFSQENIDLLWKDIEEKTGNKKADFSLYPLGKQDTKSHLPIKLETDISDTVSQEYVSPKLDSGVIIKKRANSVDWKNSLSLTAQEKADIEDPAKEYDKREENDYSTAVVLTKP